jgi:hypothetical protein
MLEAFILNCVVRGDVVRHKLVSTLQKSAREKTEDFITLSAVQTTVFVVYPTRGRIMLVNTKTQTSDLLPRVDCHVVMTFRS